MNDKSILEEKVFAQIGKFTTTFELITDNYNWLIRAILEKKGLTDDNLISVLLGSPPGRYA